jgi:hypothetical protein
MSWSKIVTDWKEFRPVRYSLGNKAWDLILTPVNNGAAGGKQDSITIGALLSSLRGSKIESVAKTRSAIRITTTSGMQIFTAPSFNIKMAEVLLELEKDGVSPSESTWFWYDQDSGLKEPMDCHYFFVVHKDAIVRDAVSFVDSFDSGFDPSVFNSEVDAEQLMSNERENEAAVATYWYRKFSQDTKIGQVMLLRPTLPPTLIPYFKDESLRTSLEALRVLTKMLSLLRVILVVVVIGVSLSLFLLTRK